ncbi:MAG: DUF4255 domain-containing protein [Deltaproteobacteria bacterium]|nr:DUF4255 domain-containing protein [Deltaproteobacteria bacterium]
MQASTLSMAARGLRAHLESNTELEATDVGFEHPASTRFSGTDTPTFSIFFYKIFSAGNNSDDHPGRPLDVIVHCILTPLSKKSTNGDNDIFPGEKDLRILGQVMQCMHQKPRFNLIDEGDRSVCEVEIIPVDLSAEELNKIVPTPPEEGFRPTVAYALSLVPIPLELPPISGPLVDIVTYSVNPDADPSIPMPMAETVTRAQKLIEKPVFDEPWKPHLYVLDEQGHPGYALQVATNQNSYNVCLLPAGPATAVSEEQKRIELVKTTWSPFTRENVFEEIIETAIAVNEVTPTVDYRGQALAVTLDTSMSCQYLFRAQRSLGDGDGGGNGDDKVKSNACLVTVVREGLE